ncbi:xan_ur_permease domain-containing protein isoform X1 [Synchiropus splendidus]|uniref:xan_ur_permease domain-containing protein isoform X1 n=1 Tax=Synchiropus splendidus TaxID=270530 RepID=UPI00237E28F5|nr:xan_ur_permease domain-containing protein isoform X1 [Synchiropus splendidus]
MSPAKGSHGLDNYAFTIDGQFCDIPDTKRKGEEAIDEDTNKLVYCVTDVPPWYLCIILGVQHCLTAFGGIVAIPLILAQGLCLQHDGLTQSHLISTIFFVSGICTLLQVTFGVRLPILQGGTFTLLAPSMAMLSMPEWTCPAWTQNATLVNTSSPEFIEVWQSRLRALQGSIMVGSLFQVFVGFSGLIGLFMRFIGPLTIAPTISLIGLSLYDSAGSSAGSHWGISAMTTVLIIIFSQYLRHIPVPFPAYNRDKKLHTCHIYVFQILPVLLGLMLSWLICYILTVYDVFPSEPDKYGYLARTDVKGDVMAQAPWLTFPYPGKILEWFIPRLKCSCLCDYFFYIPNPGQWGLPTVTLAGVFGILAGVISSMIESVGDYHACARLSGAPPPPKHAINRGIGIEGLGSLLAGAWGTGNGTTSYSENVGALGITKVGSRMVIIAGGFLMIIMGVFGKVGAIFSTLPSPVVGGMFMVMFGVICAAGVSNLQYTDMNSSRNIFIFGFSMFSGLVIPNWIIKNPRAIATGVVELDQVLQVLLTTSMFVGGFFGFILDNTIPGSKQERGILAWNKVHNEDSTNTLENSEVYNLPFGISSYLSNFPWIRYVPFCPSGRMSSLHECKGDASSLKPKQANGHAEMITVGVAL